jgi:hypothetical protein
LNRKNLEQLIKLGGEIKSYGSNNPLEGDFLHRKMCIVDSEIVMNGAYNWTKNASRNKEDYSINTDKIDAKNCLDEFNSLWNESKFIDFELIESNLSTTYEILQDLELSGVNPEQYIMEENKNMELVKVDVVSTNIFFDNLEDNYQFIYEDDLHLWGLELGNKEGTWLKLKFEFRNETNDMYNSFDTIDIAIDTKDFIEVLKKEREYFIYWTRYKKFPITMFNNLNSSENIYFRKPIHITTINSEKKYGNVKFKLITQINGKICLKIYSHYGIDLNEFEKDKINSEVDFF